jgi:hypothetical protein
VRLLPASGRGQTGRSRQGGLGSLHHSTVTSGPNPSMASKVKSTHCRIVMNKFRQFRGVPEGCTSETAWS